MIYITLCKHVTENNILSVEQFGFKEYCSTEKASYKLIKEILDSLNNKNIIVGGFYDLKNAFDSVLYKILVDKLEFSGITGSFDNVIKSCLEHRYQRVQIVRKFNVNRVYSEWGNITHGVTTRINPWSVIIPFKH